MRNVSSRFRLITSETAEMNLHAQLRAEGKGLYDSTARIVCVPGTPKKTMDELVSKAWGGYPLWRTRACRLGEAGCFSAAAMRQAQDAYKAFMTRHAARVALAAETERTRQMAMDRKLLEDLRAKHLRDLAMIEARMSILPEEDA